VDRARWAFCGARWVAGVVVWISRFLCPSLCSFAVALGVFFRQLWGVLDRLATAVDHDRQISDRERDRQMTAVIDHGRTTADVGKRYSSSTHARPKEGKGVSYPVAVPRGGLDMELSSTSRTVHRSIPNRVTGGQ
jgi:hypothetical protein